MEISCRGSDRSPPQTSATNGSAAAPLPPKEWLTSKEIGAFLGVTIDLLHDWRRRRVGPPYHRMVGRVYYRREEFTAWLQASRWG